MAIINDIPTLSVTLFRKLKPVRFAHYLVAGYDSVEQWQWAILVVVPSLTEPTWVLAPRARNANRRRSRMALAVPSLDAFTLDHAQTLVSLITDFITISEWSETDRRAGRMVRGARVTPAWQCTPQAHPVVAEAA